MGHTVFTVDNTIYEVRETPSYGNRGNDSNKITLSLSVDRKTLNTRRDKKDVVKSLAGKNRETHVNTNPLDIALAFFLIVGIFAISALLFGWRGVIVAIILLGISAIIESAIFPYPAVTSTKNEDYSSDLYKELKHGMNKINDTPLFINNNKLNTLRSQENIVHAKVSVPYEHFAGFSDVLSSCSEEERARFAHIFDLVFDEDLIDSEREKLHEALQNYIDAHASYVAANKALTPRKHAEEIEAIYSDSIIQKDVQNENYNIVNQQ